MIARLHARARRGERGSILVEAALVIPILASVLFAVIDIGMMWRADLTATNAVRSGLRVGSNVTVDPLADHAILTSLGAALGSVQDRITVEWVTVYRVDSSTATAPPAACISAAAVSAGGSVGSACNTYDATDLSSVLTDPVGSKSSFGQAGCSTGKDIFWCPTTRVVEQDTGAGPDYLGVGIKFAYRPYTAFLVSTKTMTDFGVMRLEPSGTLGGFGP